MSEIKLIHTDHPRMAEVLEARNHIDYQCYMEIERNLVLVEALIKYCQEQAEGNDWGDDSFPFEDYLTEEQFDELVEFTKTARRLTKLRQETNSVFCDMASGRPVPDYIIDSAIQGGDEE